MDDICERLDQTVLDVFQTLEDLYEKQAELEKAMKDGYLSMARARYNMGVKRVTADQIVDANFMAQRTVRVNQAICDGGLDEEADDKASKDVCGDTEDLFTLECEERCGGTAQPKSSKDGSTTNTTTTTTTATSGDKVGDGGLRRRGKDSQTEDKEWEEVKKMIGEEDKKFKLKNPINLFGVLVPQALRLSQKNFEDAVRVSIDIANQKDKLKTLQKKLGGLKDEKSKLTNQGDATEKLTDNES